MSIFLVLMIFTLIAAMSACSKKNVPPPPGYGAPGGRNTGPPRGGEWMMRSGGSWASTRRLKKESFWTGLKSFENQDVYFDYNAYTLTEPAKKILDEKLAFLKRYPKVQVTVEGNCDERGTTEYNLALGERRAHAAQQYIVNSGPANLRLTTVSYGKERPVATGHDESSFAKNRRDHFVLNY